MFYEFRYLPVNYPVHYLNNNEVFAESNGHASIFVKM